MPKMTFDFVKGTVKTSRTNALHWWRAIDEHGHALCSSTYKNYTRRHDAKRAALRMCAAFGIDTNKTPIVDAVKKGK